MMIETMMMVCVSYSKPVVLGLCRVSRVVGYPIIASGTRTQNSVRIPEMLHNGKQWKDYFTHQIALFEAESNVSVISSL